MVHERRYLSPLHLVVMVEKLYQWWTRDLSMLPPTAKIGVSVAPAASRALSACFVIRRTHLPCKCWFHGCFCGSCVVLPHVGRLTMRLIELSDRMNAAIRLDFAYYSRESNLTTTLCP